VDALRARSPGIRISALGGDHLIHQVLAMGDASDIAQPVIGGVLSVGQRRTDFRHAVLLLKTGGEIAEHEAHGHRRRSRRQIGEALERVATHDQVDLEAQRSDQRREHIRPAEVDDV